MNGLGETFVAYTEQEGGMFSPPRRCTREEFEEIKRTGNIDVTPPDRDRSILSDPIYVRPAYVMFLEGIDNFDFTLGAVRT